MTPVLSVLGGAYASLSLLTKLDRRVIKVDIFERTFEYGAWVGRDGGSARPAHHTWESHMAYKIRHENSQLRFPNRAAAERYAAEHGGLERWSITAANGSESPAPVVVDDRRARLPEL